MVNSLNFLVSSGIFQGSDLPLPMTPSLVMAAMMQTFTPSCSSIGLPLNVFPGRVISRHADVSPSAKIALPCCQYRSGW
jgi:hypothetical protein